jgi:hypothetical protein
MSEPLVTAASPAATTSTPAAPLAPAPGLAPSPLTPLLAPGGEPGAGWCVDGVCAVPGTDTPA